jgi:hypothetical protein
MNGLGFALVDSEQSHTFIRLALGSEIHVNLAPVGPTKWRVGVMWRPPAAPGCLPYALIRFSLSRLGESADDLTIDLPTRSLCETLPRLLAEAVLPLVDLAPG